MNFINQVIISPAYEDINTIGWNYGMVFYLYPLTCVYYHWRNRQFLLMGKTPLISKIFFSLLIPFLKVLKLHN